MVLILIKLYLSRDFASIVRFSNTISVIVNATISVIVGITIGITISITIKDGRFCPIAITVTIYIYIFIISNAR